MTLRVGMSTNAAGCVKSDYLFMSPACIDKFEIDQGAS